MRTLTVVTLLALMATLATAQDATITGRVVGPDGEGVAGARVAAVVSFTAPLSVEWTETVSGEDGSFEFATAPALPDGTTIVVATAEGLGIWGAFARGAGPVEIRLSDDLGAISGTVRDTAAHAVEGATVRVIALMREGQEEPGAWLINWHGAPQATTDAEGHFTIADLPAGTRAALQTEAEAFANALNIDEDQWPVVGEANDVALTMQPASFITGRVTHDGQPVEGVKVNAMATEPPISWSDAVTDADGRYEIGGLGGGTFIVMPQARDNLIAGAHDDVPVQAGARVEGIDFELSTGALVRGRVTWEDSGEPVAGTFVVTTGGMGIGNRAQTDEDGRYELRVAPGTHRVQWGRGGADEARGSEPDHHEITVAADQLREGVDFALLRKKTIVLTVLGPDGEPIRGASVWWDASERYGAPEAIEPILTDEEGQARLLYGRQDPPAPQGMAEQWPPLAVVVVQEIERGLAGMAHFDAEAEDAITLTLDAGGWVEADVQDQDGEPIADVPFRVNTRDQNVYYPELPLRMSTDADGHLRVGPLPPNVLLEIAPSWRHRSVTLQPRPQEMPTAELAPGETREIGPFVLAPDGLTVRGRVIDADGNPVAGAVVVTGNGIGWQVVRAEADVEGRFELERIGTDEDTATIIAAAPDGSAAWAEPVDPTIAFEPTIQLGTPGTIIVTVRGADGRPVEGIQVGLSPNSLRTPRPMELPGALAVSAQDLRSDAEGRVRIERLVPGLEYSVSYRPNPDDDEWHGQGVHMIYGGEEPVEVDVTLGE